MYDKRIEDYARRLSVCPGCNGPKDLGHIVCWDCFKYRSDVPVFKYHKSCDLNEWLALIGMPPVTLPTTPLVPEEIAYALQDKP